jgi:uncharacterized protein (DUF433 family)
LPPHPPRAAINPIQTDPEILGGAPCFAGTQVPLQNLFDYIAHSRPIDEFLMDFPTVTREQVQADFEPARQRLAPTPAA